MTNDELIARAKAALEGVTEGPWVVEYKHGCTNLIMNGDNKMSDETYYPWTPDNLKDWEFFAASRDLVPALIAALKASEARVENCKGALDEMKSREDRAWKPMQIMRSDAEVELDEARHEVWMDAVKILEDALKGGAE